MIRVDGRPAAWVEVVGPGTGDALAPSGAGVPTAPAGRALSRPGAPGSPSRASPPPSTSSGTPPRRPGRSTRRSSWPSPAAGLPPASILDPIRSIRSAAPNSSRIIGTPAATRRGRGTRWRPSPDLNRPPRAPTAGGDRTCPRSARGSAPALGHPRRLRPARRQRRLPRQRHGVDLVEGDHAADVLLHADGRRPPAAGLRPDRPVPRLRVRPPGDLVEAAEQGGGPLRPGAAGRVDRDPVSGLVWSGSAGSRSATRRSARSATGCTSSRRLLAIGLYVKHRLAGPEDPLGLGSRVGAGVGVAVRAVDGAAALAGPADVRRQGAEGGRASTSSRRRRSRPTATSSRPRP